MTCLNNTVYRDCGTCYKFIPPVLLESLGEIYYLGFWRKYNDTLLLKGSFGSGGSLVYKEPIRERYQYYSNSQYQVYINGSLSYLDLSIGYSGIKHGKIVSNRYFKDNMYSGTFLGDIYLGVAPNNDFKVKIGLVNTFDVNDFNTSFSGVFLELSNFAITSFTTDTDWSGHSFISGSSDLSYISCDVTFSTDLETLTENVVVGWTSLLGYKRQKYYTDTSSYTYYFEPNNSLTNSGSSNLYPCIIPISISILPNSDGRSIIQGNIGTSITNEACSLYSNTYIEDYNIFEKKCYIEVYNPSGLNCGFNYKYAGSIGDSEVSQILDTLNCPNSSITTSDYLESNYPKTSY